MARLTVIITTFNRRQLLPKAVESIRNSGTDAEIIVVDDASTDDTKEYCERLEGIRYIRMDRNQGTAAARNAGIKECRTPFIAFLDDDDWRLPGTFQLQLDLLEKNENCALVYGKVLYSNQNRELTGDSNISQPSPQGNVSLQLLHRNFITLSTVVARKECLVKYGMFDTSPAMLGLEDWDMWLRLSGGCQVLAVQVPVAVYRKPEKNSGQWYSDIGRQYSLAADAYRKKWFHLPGVKEQLGAEFRETKKEILAHTSDVIIYGALNNALSAKQKMARLWSAVICWPRNLVSLRFYKALAKAILNRK